MTLYNLYGARSTYLTTQAQTTPTPKQGREQVQTDIINTWVTLTDSAMYKAGTKVIVTGAAMRHGYAVYDCEYTFKHSHKTCVTRFTARACDIRELADAADVVTAKKKCSRRRIG